MKLTKKKYRKIIQIVCTILFVLNVFLLGRLFYLKNENRTKETEIVNLNLESSSLDEEITEKEDVYKTMEEDNHLLIEEYENWQSQNQKLEDILG